jgi:hypothetical protein
MEVVAPLLLHAEERLVDYNIHARRALCSVVGISAEFHRQSEMQVAGNATELLVAITKAVGADIYLCGGGASGYQDDDLFAHHHGRRNIR